MSVRVIPIFHRNCIENLFNKEPSFDTEHLQMKIPQSLKNSFRNDILIFKVNLVVSSTERRTERRYERREIS
jgi:hypothetical protein